MMKMILKIFSPFCAALFFTSCVALQTSMSPTQVYNNLPQYTKALFITAAKADSLNCKRLVKGRSYTAPMGLTVIDDLKNGAKGIDEWVTLDGGNAYVLTNYQWVTVSYNSQHGTSATQLQIEFDTYLCK